mgnify:CR=1 FL=1
MTGPLSLLLISYATRFVIVPSPNRCIVSVVNAPALYTPWNILKKELVFCDVFDVDAVVDSQLLFPKSWGQRCR